VLLHETPLVDPPIRDGLADAAPPKRPAGTWRGFWAALHRRRQRPASIERVLVLRLGSILVAAFLSFGVFYGLFIAGDAREQAAEEAADLAEALESSIVVQAGGLHFDLPADLAARIVARHALYGGVETAGGAAVGGSDPAVLARLRRGTAAQVQAAELTRGPGGLTLFAAAEGIAGVRALRVGVLQPVSNAGLAWTGVMREYREEILPTFAPALVLAFAVVWVTVRRSLQPLRRASAEAAAVSAERPGRRVSMDGVGAEIVPLIEAVNHAVARLEAALAVQTRFTANAAHEMRTPLAIIRARIDNLQDGPEKLAFQRDMDRVTRLVSQMLASARLQSGQVGRFERVDLVALARSTLADLAPLADAGGKELVLESGAPASVHGNAMSLESALRNLVENALRFTPAGEAVTVRVGPGPRIEVADRGPGIPADHLAHIFEPFWRAQDQRGDGAGLGLAIARDVALLHGGRLEVRNGVVGGAVFALDFPRQGAF
jgi:signal transduction histidine kinase